MCRFLGVDGFDDMQVELEFVNPIGDVESITVTYALLDGTGTRFSTHEERIQYPDADQSFRQESDTLTELPATVNDVGVSCEVLEVAEGFAFGEAEAPADPTSCEFVEVDSFDDIQIELTVTSPFEDTTDVQATYALYADGVRFSSSVAIIELVAPGETVRSSQDTLTEPPAWSEPAALTCDVRAVEVIDF
ncbi:MAG: hypothetical protein WD225_08655 [Ilumatobacteraceae bacterium]